MSRYVLLVLAVLWGFPNSGYAQTAAPTRLIQIMSPKEFLQLSDDLQTAFVGGIIDGMAFTAYGMSWPDYPRWAECVRVKALGETTREVVAYLKATPDFKEGVSGAVAGTLGKRCKKS